MRFGKLKVVSLKYYSNDALPKYLLKCDCGKVCAIEIVKLTSGESQSCGCDAPSVSRVTTFTCRNLTMTLREWSEYVGINVKTLRSRLRRGWDLEKTLFTAVRLRNQKQLANIFFEALANAAA